MLTINSKEISLNKGDSGIIKINIMEGEESLILEATDNISLMIYKEENLDKEPLKVIKAMIDEENNVANITINEDTTSFVEEDNEPFNYWYQIEFNDNVIIGYDKEGPKIFRVYPSGKGE